MILVLEAAVGNRNANEESVMEQVNVLNVVATSEGVPTNASGSQVVTTVVETPTSAVLQNLPMVSMPGPSSAAGPSSVSAQQSALPPTTSNNTGVAPTLTTGA